MVKMTEGRRKDLKGNERADVDMLLSRTPIERGRLYVWKIGWTPPVGYLPFTNRFDGINPSTSSTGVFSFIRFNADIV